jgi:hypothetical protein
MELDRYETELRDTGKARNTITTYVYPVERFLNWLEGRYRRTRTAPAPPAGPRPSGRSAPNRGGRSRYDGLRNYLLTQSDPVVRLSFVEIERIIGGQLPASARRHRPWWANEQSGTHAHARSWLDANRRTAHVDLNAGTVDFVA